MHLSEETTSPPAVSVGMPVYNGEKFIRQALDSLLTQSFTNFEIVISDNTSTDGTEAICREYSGRDPRIRYIRQERNCGAAANFEFVLNATRGEYFMWAASDDYEASQDYLLALVTAMKQGDYGLVFPAFEMVSTSEGGITRLVHANIMDKFLTCKTHEDFCVASVSLYFQIYGLFKREALIQNIRYFQSTGNVVSADVLLVQALSVNLRIRYVPEVTKIYRIHESQLSNTLSPRHSVAQYLKVSRLCVAFWLWEAKAPFRTKRRVMLAILRFNGYGIMWRALHPAKLFTLRMMGRARVHSQ